MSYCSCADCLTRRLVHTEETAEAKLREAAAHIGELLAGCMQWRNNPERDAARAWLAAYAKSQEGK